MPEHSFVKVAARRLGEQLPENATWEDLLHAIHICRSMEAGLKDSEAGRLLPVSEVRRAFGLPT